MEKSIFYSGKPGGQMWKNQRKAVKIPAWKVENLVESVNYYAYKEKSCLNKQKARERKRKISVMLYK